MNSLNAAEMDTLLCQAITTSGKPCKKRRTKQGCFCNTHLVSATTACSSLNVLEGGVQPPVSSKKTNKTKEVEIKEIRGIPYYIDTQNNVYKHEEIFKDNPSIIGQYNSETESILFLPQPPL